MLSDQENRRLAEIELQLRTSDPRFVSRMGRPMIRRRPWFLRWLVGTG